VKKIIYLFVGLLLPSLVLVIFIFIIDPFNYFNYFNFIDYNIKRNVAGRINYPIWKILEYKSFPEKNIILGDSRMNALDTKKIFNITNEKYYNFSYGGGTIYEAIDTFYYLEKKYPIKKVIFGLDILNFNSNQKLNRVEGAIKIANSPFLYLTNYISLYAAYKEFYYKFLNITPNIEAANLSKKYYWDNEINKSIPQLFYNYKYPYEIFNKLKNLTVFCRDKNIELIFVIPPMHNDATNKILSLNMGPNIVKFIEEIKSINKVIDLSQDKNFNFNDENFKDPFHYENIEFLLNGIFKVNHN
jgi:hypothetical protein